MRNAGLPKEVALNVRRVLQCLFLAPALASAVHGPTSMVRSTIKIVQGQRAGEKAWENSRSRTERTIIDEQGRRLVLRLIEFE